MSRPENERVHAKPLPTERLAPLPTGMQTSPFTTAEIARATGRDRRSVARALSQSCPATKIMRDGNETKAWEEMDLPDELREASDPYDLRALAEMVKVWKDPHRPTDSEQARLLDCAFLKLYELTQRGASGRVMKARQIAWLGKHAPALAENGKALRRMFNRYYRRWVNAGRKPAAIFDQRPQNAKSRRAPQLPQADLDRIVAFAVHQHGGKLDPAWRRCWPELDQTIRERYPLAREVPAKIRQQVLPEIRRLMPWHIGPRAAKLNGCYLERDWSGVFAGDWHSSDDVTLPVYFYDPENPRELLRGQFLPMIDVKSQRILDFAFEVAKSYTAATIRALISRVCSRYGLPRHGWHFESGIWKKAKILGGGAKCQPWDDVGETFADRLGLRICNSLPGNARAKVVERVIGILQDMMEGEPGYVGRNEMAVKYERVQRAKLDVESGRVHPSEAGFLSVDQWLARLHVICDGYNAKERESEVMGAGRMCPDDAWEKLQARDSAGAIDPLVKLPTELRYLLAAHKEIVQVTRAGIRLFNGKYRYASEVTGMLNGESVISWFDPEHPETLAVTDMKGDNLRTVPVVEKLPAYDAWETQPEMARASSRAVNAHNGYGRRRYSELKAKFFPPTRAIVADAEAIQKGRDMALQRDELKDRNHAGALDDLEATKQELRDRLARAEDFERGHALDFV